MTGNNSNSNNGGGGGAAPGSGRGSPDHDLAQSLASLKIAMTQQQLAAAAGSVSRASGPGTAQRSCVQSDSMLCPAVALAPAAGPLGCPRACQPHLSAPSHLSGTAATPALQNHEVVITTLHQILKDAMAQQGSGSISASASFGAGPGGESGSGSASAAVVAAAVAAQQQLAAQMANGGGDNGSGACWGAPQHNAFCSSPSGHSFGSGGSSCLSTPPAPLACCQRCAACFLALPIARCCRWTHISSLLPLPPLGAAGGPSISSSLAGSVPQFHQMSPQSSSVGSHAEAAAAAVAKAGPALSSSPDAIACYEAAMVAAAGGYPGLMPLGAQQRSMSPRTSGESTSGGLVVEEPAAPLPAGEAGVGVEAGGM